MEVSLELSNTLRDLRQRTRQVGRLLPHAVWLAVGQGPGNRLLADPDGTEQHKLFQRGIDIPPHPQARSWVHYVNVESLDAAIEQVQRLGGKVLRPKTAVPKTAWYAVVQDPEGNIFAIWQPDPTAFPPPEPD
ncbi:MAG: VOC family protein [Terriglobales bacterium]